MSESTGKEKKSQIFIKSGSEKKDKKLKKEPEQIYNDETPNGYKN